MWVTNCQFYLLTQVKGAFFSLVFQRETSVTLNGPVEVSLDDRLRWFGSHFVSVIVCDLIIQFQWEQTTTTTTWRNPNVIWSGGQKEADTPGSCPSREGKRKKKKVKGQSDESLDKKNDVNSPMRHVFYQRKRENWAEQENSGFS